MLLALAVILIVVGIAGTVLPALPGPFLVFGGVLLAAWADDFTRIGPWTLAAAGVLTALTLVIDIAASALGVKRVGGSGRAAVGASLGALAGIFLGLPGLLLGPFVGAVIAELTVRADIRHAGYAGLAAWVGFIVGNVAKLAIVFAVVGLAAAAYWF